MRRMTAHNSTYQKVGGFMLKHYRMGTKDSFVLAQIRSSYENLWVKSPTYYSYKNDVPQPIKRREKKIFNLTI
jgi:ppGpp synthetase/RelA/SpoT-type nucleotidyltranferase